MKKAPPFSWPAYEAAIARDPEIDPFTRFCFSHLRKSEKSEIALQLVERKLKQAKEAQHD